ncbi:hypothetical protein Daus18300_001095 [Diaporthe australafricana]|uniref:Uncharacterized protein n=1 Tax=Diaporthe australafricana TaxID=127596 RepID=A0ABR3XZ03_9PEZI
MAEDAGIINASDRPVYTPGVGFVAIIDATVEVNDGYGDIYFPGSQQEFNSMGPLHTKQANAEVIMNIQQRIYRFLENATVDILATQSYSGNNENQQTNWKLTDPTGLPQNAAEQTALELYLSRSHDLLPYLSGNADTRAHMVALCARRMRAAEDFLQGLKEDPNRFLEFLTDIREHSNHQILNYPGNDQHPWASLIML